MEQLLQKILEINPYVVYFAVLFFAFVPGSCVVLIRKLNRWIKTAVVLVFGELGAVILWSLSRAAKTAEVDSVLVHFTELAILLAIMILGYAIVGHIFNWDHRVVKGLKKKEDSEQ